ncbi:MAG: sodium-dependent transporter [Kordiimonadaceae bacterium]|nr:sodium-dependent transporter [Kordiimonadaceae bacterium]
MAGAAKRVKWSSKYTFILAAVGSAVGLGNIWKFPYQAGLNGGGAFVLFYLAFVFLVGLPVLMAELSIGRRAQKSPIPAMEQIAKEEGRSKLWVLLGWSGVLGGFTIITYYSVVGGWVLAYIAKAAAGFSGFDAHLASDAFNSFSSDPVQPVIWHISFMAITIAIVARGVKGGLEKAVTILMPALFVLLTVMVVYAGINGNFAQTLNFLFTPDFEKLLYNTSVDATTGDTVRTFTIDRVLNALGLAFFSLSLGMGSIMTYGSYLTKDVNIGRSALTIAVADSAVAIMAGLAIFPIVFATPGAEAAGGVGLVFKTLPIAFGQMPAGQLVGATFFFLLAFAAITSAISLLEPAVSFIGERTGGSRMKVSIIVGSTAATIGLLSAWAMPGSLLGDVTIFGMDIMSAKSYLTDNLMMPLGGLFIAIFAGWFISRKSAMEELVLEDSSFKKYYFLVRYVCPIAIAAVFISVLFV